MADCPSCDVVLPLGAHGGARGKGESVRERVFTVHEDQKLGGREGGREGEEEK